MAHNPHIPNATYQTDLMLQTKHNLPFGSREENLKVFFTIYGHGAHFGKVTRNKCNILFYLTHTPFKI